MSHYPHSDADGYGVYEFTPRPGGVFGAIPDLTAILSNIDLHIDKSSGIQVLKGDLQASAIQGLDEKTDFTVEMESTDGKLKTGTIEAGLVSGGDDWASKYVGSGYAVLVDKSSISVTGLGGSARALVTNVPGYIADNAKAGAAYVVVSGHPELIAKAAEVAAGGPPGGVVDPGHGSPVPAPPPPVMVPVVQKSSTPEWMWPAIVVAGGLALIAFTKAGIKK